MPHDEPTPAGPRLTKGGFTIKEYEARVWDMARHQLHPTFLFVAAQVAGATRLLAHPAYAAPGGWAREAALFLAGFLGAWGVLYSTLLRVAGLRSLAVTIVVPAALLVAIALWTVAPGPESLGDAGLLGAEALLAAPGVVAWIATMRRWRAARREASA